VDAVTADNTLGFQLDFQKKYSVAVRVSLISGVERTPLEELSRSSVLQFIQDCAVHRLFYISHFKQHHHISRHYNISLDDNISRDDNISCDYNISRDEFLSMILIIV